MSDISLETLGSFEHAQIAFQKMLEGSSAYKNKLMADFGALNVEWSKLPLLTKKNFYSLHSWSALMPSKSINEIYSVTRSSGTTQTKAGNRGFFWPQLRSEDTDSVPLMQKMLSEAFSLHEKKTLVVIGLSLGSWAGGEQFSFLFKNLAYQANYPLAVFSPGNHHLEILEMLARHGDDFDQILIAICPSAIFYLTKLSEETGIPMPLKKITYVVTGEAFPESMRLALKKSAGQSMAEMTIMSIYGSADSGFIGFESLPLIRMRQALSAQPELAKLLGFSAAAVPNLFHVQKDETFYELVEEDLVITKWQGMPLVRYNLQDRVKFFSWKQTCLLFAETDKRRRAFWQHFATLPLTDFMAVFGRSSGCVIIGESKIYETMLQDVLFKSSIQSLISGEFVVWSENIEGQQVLGWQIELKPNIDPSDAWLNFETLHPEFIALLSQQQQAFADDYDALYRHAVAQGHRFFRFHFCPFGHLTNNENLHKAVKRKIIIDQGPL